MSNFKKALHMGFDAAKTAAAARMEIKAVLKRLKDEILSETSGALILEVKTFQEDVNSARGMSALSALSRGWVIKTYQAITARNALAEKSQHKQLARWKISKDGYPCTLTVENEERQYGDRESLEQGLENLLSDVRIAEILISVINEKPSEA